MLGEKCNTDSTLTIDKKPLKHSIILNKPLGFVSSQPENNYKPAITLITKNNYHGNNKNLNLDKFFFKKLAVAGRLDINSSGLLIFTQDGVLAKKVIGNNSSIEKEYLVTTNHNITNNKLSELKNVDRIDNKPIKKFIVSKLKINLLKFILFEGKNRQIRKMCEQVNIEILSLIRVRIGNIKLNNLPRGKWKFISPNEL